jgi:hypothetical protein
MKYVVPIIYRGQANYVVEASSFDEAKILAREAFEHGKDTAEEVPLGNEWEEIEKFGTVEEADETEVGFAQYIRDLKG